MNSIKTDNCQVCGNKLSEPTLNLGNHPLCDDLKPITTKQICKEYPIIISLCDYCLTANQLYNLKKEELFPNNYHYRPRFTLDVLSGMKELVEQVNTIFGDLNGKLVCDIGCNDGTLLNFFKEKKCDTCGIEPTGAALEAQKNHPKILNQFFDINSAKKIISEFGYPEIITFTNVFAHIENLQEGIEALKLMLKKDTILIIENHYLGTVIKTNQFDTFYHEHPRTYSKKSFEVIAKKLETKLIGVFFPKRYGGNIRVYLTNKSLTLSTHLLSEIDETNLFHQFHKMKDFIDQWILDTRNSIIEFNKKYGKIYGKSFPGRAAILIKLLNIGHDVMPVIYEKNGSMKLDHYVPGSKIKIVSDNLWIKGHDKPEIIIIWAWHIHEEIAQYMRRAGYKGRIFTPLPKFKEIL